MSAVLHHHVENTDVVAREKSSLVWWVVGGIFLSVCFALAGLVFVQRGSQVEAINRLDALGVYCRSEPFVKVAKRDAALDYYLRGTEPIVSVRLMQRQNSPEAWRELYAAIRSLPYLRTIRCAQIHATAAELLPLLENRRLRALDVAANDLNDEFIDDVVKLTELDYLVLDRTMITDEGVAQLVVLSKLEMVSLEKTNISEASLETLVKLPNLKRVYLIGCSLSDAAIAEFRASRPEVTVFR